MTYFNLKVVAKYILLCIKYILLFRLSIHVLYSFTNSFSTFYIGLLFTNTVALVKILSRCDWGFNLPPRFSPCWVKLCHDAVKPLCLWYFDLQIQKVNHTLSACHICNAVSYSCTLNNQRARTCQIPLGMRIFFKHARKSVK